MIRALQQPGYFVTKACFSLCFVLWAILLLGCNFGNSSTGVSQPTPSSGVLDNDLSATQNVIYYAQAYKFGKNNLILCYVTPLLYLDSIHVPELICTKQFETDWTIINLAVTHNAKKLYATLGAIYMGKSKSELIVCNLLESGTLSEGSCDQQNALINYEGKSYMLDQVAFSYNLATVPFDEKYYAFLRFTSTDYDFDGYVVKICPVANDGTIDFSYANCSNTLKSVDDFPGLLTIEQIVPRPFTKEDNKKINGVFYLFAPTSTYAAGAVNLEIEDDQITITSTIVDHSTPPNRNTEKQLLSSIIDTYSRSWSGDFIGKDLSNISHLFYILSEEDEVGHEEGFNQFSCGITDNFIGCNEKGNVSLPLSEEDLYMATYLDRVPDDYFIKDKLPYIITLRSKNYISDVVTSAYTICRYDVFTLMAQNCKTYALSGELTASAITTLPINKVPPSPKTEVNLFYLAHDDNITWPQLNQCSINLITNLKQCLPPIDLDVPADKLAIGPINQQKERYLYLINRGESNLSSSISQCLLDAQGNYTNNCSTIYKEFTDMEIVFSRGMKEDTNYYATFLFENKKSVPPSRTLYRCTLNSKTMELFLDNCVVVQGGFIGGIHGLSSPELHQTYMMYLDSLNNPYVAFLPFYSSYLIPGNFSLLSGKKIKYTASLYDKGPFYFAFESGLADNKEASVTTCFSQAIGCSNLPPSFINFPQSIIIALQPFILKDVNLSFMMIGRHQPAKGQVKEENYILFYNITNYQRGFVPSLLIDINDTLLSAVIDQR
jgi:hypothetical protein